MSDKAKSIEEMEGELDGLIVDAPPPPQAVVDVDDPWRGERRQEDKFSETDGEQRVRLYTLSIPNKVKIGDKDNPGFRKLCLDKKLSIEPRDIIRCIVLDRVKPRICVLPFKQSESIPADEPWKKYLGYSFDGKSPTPNKKGEYFSKCLLDGKPYSICSLGSRFEKDGEAIVTPLQKGECPWGRWPNTLPDETLVKFKIKDDTPMCGENIIFYVYDLDVLVPFRIFFKSTSIGYARDFLRSCTRGLGDDAVKYPWYAFESHITVEDKGTYAIPKIVNTNKFTDPRKIKPIIDWFNTNKGIFIKNLADEMLDAKERKEKEVSFSPEEGDKGAKDANRSK